MRRGLKIFLAGIVLLPVLAIAGLYAADFVLDPTGYNRERWVAYGSAEADGNGRSAMLRDVEGRLRAGMSETDVVDLLGKPNTAKPGRYSYSLGSSPYGIDREHFVILFGADARVSEWRLERD